MADVLLVSKPVAPPWTDGAKNLVRDLCAAQSGRHRVVAMVPGDQRDAPLGPGVVAEPVYATPGQYAPAATELARVLWRLARPSPESIHHYFFAPNPRTNAVANALYRVRSRKVIHTIPSEPTDGARWFADVHVAVTEWTRNLLARRGAKHVRLIPPGIPDVTLPSRTEARTQLDLPMDRPMVLFAGDLTATGGAEALAEAAEGLDVLLVFATRPKGEGHVERRARLETRLGPRARWFGQVDEPTMTALVAAANVQCLPATSLHAKLDLPMVLIESLRAGVPVVVTNLSPLRELGRTVDGVLKVPPNDPAKLRDTLTEALRAGPSAARHARARYEAAFTARAMAHAYEDLWDEVSR